jgi:hypothetical protein
MIDGSLKYIDTYISIITRKLTVKEKTQLNCSKPNDSGNRRHRAEHNKKKCSLLDGVRVRVCEGDRINQGRTREKERKKRVISATITTATSVGASSVVPQ